MPRRMRSPKFLDDVGKRKPLGNVEPFLQPPAKLGTGNIQNVITVVRLVDRHILRAILDIDHHAERHH